MKKPAPKRIVIGAVTQLVLAILIAFSTGTVWLLNASMLRSSPPTGVRDFDTPLMIGFAASLILVIVAAFHVDSARRIFRSSEHEHTTA